MIERIKKNLKSKLCLAFLFCLFLFGLYRLYDKMTDDFSLANMTYEMPHHPEWEIPALSENEAQQLHQILDQKFTYLGKGAQSYVFSSEDNQYVIKFFKFKHVKPIPFVDALPSREKNIQRKNRKLKSAFEGYHLAFSHHKQASGLIFIHLNKTTDLKQQILIIDKIGRSYDIDLDRTVFLLQKKGETLKTVMKDLLKKEDISLAKKRVEQIFDLYVSEYKQGIYDLDHRVMSNTGFIGEQPIHLDVGKFLRDETMKQSSVYKNDLHIIYNTIDLWIEKHFPKQHEEITQELKEKYLELTLQH